MGERKHRTSEWPFIPPVDLLLRSTLLFGVVEESRIETQSWEAGAPHLARLRMAGLGLELASSPRQDPPDDALHVLRAAARREAATGLMLEAALPELSSRLDEAGIEWVLLKGPTLSGADPRLATRSYVDIDVMISTQDRERATAVMLQMGFLQHLEGWEPRVRVAKELRHSITLRRGSVVVDLHGVIPPIVFGRRLPFERIRERSERKSLAGVSVMTPCVVHSAIIAALHVLSSGGGRWPRPWRDAVVLLSRREEARDLADEVVALGLRRPFRAVAESITRAWGVQVPSLERLGRRAMLGRSPRMWALDWRRPWAEHQFAEAARMPLVLALRFVWSFAFPSRAAIQTRYAGKRAGLRLYLRWWKDLLGRVALVSRGRKVRPRLPGLEQDLALAVAPLQKPVNHLASTKKTRQGQN